MMKTLQYWKLCLLAAVIGVFLNRLPAQNTSQQLAFAGLRSIAAQGQINAVKTDSAGNIYLLLDQKDGVRLLKTDNAASKILAQAQLGARGDIGLAMALDPAGNVYITGTTTSATLTATTGAAIPNRTDTSTQSFVAKFSPDLSPVFVTFTGGSKIAASALTSTADSVFVTGVTYAANLPVTPNGIQQTPAYQSTQNGFVEKFSATGASLLYATYLTGANGDTTPTSIVADSADNAYITGATSASGFPTIAALVPAILSNPSGFLTKLTPAGDGIVFSTFIPGPGITSIALDTTSQTLLLSGSVELGKFPVDKVSTPLIPTTYQVLLRLPLDGSAVESATLIAPGTQSFVAPGPSGTVWVDGSLTAPVMPSRCGSMQPMRSTRQPDSAACPPPTPASRTSRPSSRPSPSTQAGIPTSPAPSNPPQVPASSPPRPTTCPSATAPRRPSHPPSWMPKPPPQRAPAASAPAPQRTW
jgi:hypothetical protein